jgi:hypothetical protein
MSDGRREVYKTERGWAGHFCAARDCRFRRNTLLECQRQRIVVSTVGAYFLPEAVAKVLGEPATVLREIGAGRYYETMAFQAKWLDGYWDADVTKEIEFESPWSISAPSPDSVPEDVDNIANEMHEAVVEEIRGRLERGETL